MRRALLAEGLGSTALAATVIGSGIMAERLAGGNVAVMLLANTFATIAALAVLIAVLGSISGAHFNPAVTLIMSIRGHVPLRQAVEYAMVQFVGCCVGAVLAHAMFQLPLLQASTHLRGGFGQLLSEAVATAGLILVVLASPGPKEASWRVPAWIGAAYWFTSSTSFANPAITVGRSLSDTFAGIAPSSVPAFIAAQLCGALLGLLLARTMLSRPAIPPAS
jgi:glycerol uptake facilitator-like aquaporin